MKIELSGHYGYRRLISSSVPSILMMLTVSLYSIVDGLFISNYTDTTAFAAMNLIAPGIMVIGALGQMFGTGGSAFVAMILGQGDQERANRAFSMLIRVMLVAGAICGVLFFIFTPRIAIWMGADESMLSHCLVYGRIFIVVIPLFMAQMAFQSLYMTAEMPQTGTRISIICGLINIVFDALFITVFHWGLAGAAIATAMSAAFGGLYPLIYFSSGKFNKSKLRLSRTKTDWKSIGHICTNGLSEYVGSISLNIVCICYNLQLMKLIGEPGVAVYGILMYIGFAYASVYIGYNLAIAPVISYNYGAQNYSELKTLLRKSLILLLVIGTVLTLLSEVLSNVMASIFVGYDPELKALTGRAIRIYMLSFMICGLNMFVSAWFTALNNGVVSAIAAFARTLIFELGSIFLLPLLLGLDGVWLAVDLADVMALIMSAILLTVYRKRYHY